MQIIKAARGNINTRHGEDAGRSFPHVGIDIGWGEGLELYAPAAGWITWAWVGTYGNRCIIRHDDGTWSLIAHADGFFGANGHEVEQGEHIGTMGRTGGPWGTAGWYVHCHQEYHLANGFAVDPERYIGSGTAGGNGTPIEEDILAGLTNEEQRELHTWMKSVVTNWLPDTQNAVLRGVTGVQNIQARLTVPGYTFDYLQHISHQIIELGKTLGVDVDEAALAEQLKGVVTEALKQEIVAAVLAALPEDVATNQGVIDAIRSVTFTAK